MKWNKKKNFGQIVRNYENNDVNISYFTLIDYLYILVIIMNQEIIRVERCGDYCQVNLQEKFVIFRKLFVL